MNISHSSASSIGAITPEVFAIKDGRIYGFEIKDVKGKQSEGQIKFGNGMNQAGGIYMVVRDIDDVMAVL